MYSSPRAQWVMTPTRFDCVPEGTNIAASKPSTSSPTSAAAIAERMPGLGRVTVSLRKSVAIRTPWLTFALQLWKQDHVADRRRIGQQHHQAIDADPFARRRRQSVFHRANVV